MSALAKHQLCIDDVSPSLTRVRQLLGRYNSLGRLAHAKGENLMTQPNDQATASRDSMYGSPDDRPVYTGGDRRKPSRFDLTINLPTLIMMIGMCVTSIGFVFGVYSSLDKRITELEASDKQQELHFNRLELAQADSRTELRQSVDRLGDKVDKLVDKLSFNSAGNRPETQRWTRN